MEVGRVVEWLKQDGEPVEAGDLILAIESDKAVSEVEALDSGILRIPADPLIGVELPVGARLGFIIQAGEYDPFAASPVIGDAVASTADPPQSVQIDSQPVSTSPRHNGNGAAEQAISPRARRVAEDLGVDWTLVAGSGSTGRIRERDIRAAAVATSPFVSPRATPSVRRLAEEAGIDLATIPAGRPGGRVTRSDVLAASATPTSGSFASEPISPVRRVIIERMTEAVRTVAPVTLTSDVDATELARLRSSLKKEAGGTDPVPSFNDLIARLAALCLVEHPGLNATLQGDRIQRHEAVHLGLAVDTERGLLVPVIRDADHKGVHQIAAESARLIEQTRAGSVATDELKGSTFTITNLGMFDIDAFTPIINLPECAILGLGRIQSRPVVIDEESETIAVRKMMALSLTFDHRVVDGAPAARFLQALRRKIERPYTWLIR
jgi:pyruvate dehydrogenase E2 component (dihydrolipoamide acetyltransferase)